VNWSRRGARQVQAKGSKVGRGGEARGWSMRGQRWQGTRLLARCPGMAAHAQTPGVQHGQTQAHRQRSALGSADVPRCDCGCAHAPTRAARLEGARGRWRGHPDFVACQRGRLSPTGRNMGFERLERTHMSSVACRTRASRMMKGREATERGRG
jgi:hypothetical protein